jgi:hypothetical protein
MAAAVLLALYLGSYVLNSAFGGYWPKPERDGMHRWSFGMAMHTAILWQPAYGYCARFNSDGLGAFYSPLVVLDRRWFHPTMYVTDESTFEWFNRKARAADIHPQWRAEFINSRSH